MYLGHGKYGLDAVVMVSCVTFLERWCLECCIVIKESDSGKMRVEKSIFSLSFLSKVVYSVETIF